MRTRRALTMILAASLWLPAAPSAAAPADASRAPRTSGPLVGNPLGCEDNGRAGRNELRGQSCSWSYLLPAHADAAHEYSAFWTQVEIDPGKGMCAQMIEVTVDLHGNGRIVSAAPAKGGRATGGGITELVVDADGAAPVPGRIEQDVSVPSGRTSATVGEHRYRYVWRGNAKEKVVIAVGVQLSHGRVPPDVFASYSIGTGTGGGSCSPAIAHLMSRV